MQIPYLVRFAQVKEDFRLEELYSICQLRNIPFPEQDVSPFWIAHFDSEENVKRILERAILIQSITELWSYGKDLGTVLDEIRCLPSSVCEPYREVSFRFEVDDYMKKIQQDARVTLINKFSFMPLNGPVKMKNAQVVFTIHCDGTNGNVYFGRNIGMGRRDLVDQFNLKKRQYLGTTSMDSELSLVMCNLAKVDFGDLMYDPFVGTGSFLCTASFFGARVIGSDIDGRQMRGSGDCSILSNLNQYGVSGKFVDGLVFDILQNPWREGWLIDSIITDPPYGVRAGAKKIGTISPYPPSCSITLTPEEKSNRYPKTIPYEMSELAIDLHLFAAKFLKVGGRLVYWYPIEFGEGRKGSTYDEVRKLLPNVSGMKFISMTLQKCRMFERWLVIFERIPF